jgi:hypothetical protein
MSEQAGTYALDPATATATALRDLVTGPERLGACVGLSRSSRRGQGGSKARLSVVGTRCGWSRP